MIKTARSIVLDLLLKEDVYSNLALDHAISQNNFLSIQDRRLITILYYGVIERKLTLRYVIGLYSNKPLRDISQTVVMILSMGLYQLLYLDTIPDHAAINESVQLAKQNGQENAAGFINGILRSFLRNQKKISLPSNDKLLTLSLEYSCPLWLIKLWNRNYGEEIMGKLLPYTLRHAPSMLRINPLKGTTDQLQQLLQDEGIVSRISDIASDCLIVEHGLLEQTKARKNGWFHIQDISSQLCCAALNPQPEEVIFDLCAAPGGKSFTIAEMMQDRGKIYSFDIHSHRVKLIQDGANTLGLSCITALAGDGRQFQKQLPLADKVLCDVPCSGLGVIWKKPEIKYKKFEDIADIPTLQYEILCNAAKYLRLGGELVYSTCTLNPAENEEVAKRFLASNPQFEPCEFLGEMGKPFGSWQTTIFPFFFESDGFFISKFRRIRS